jgi:hypothetical protein
VHEREGVVSRGQAEVLQLQCEAAGHRSSDRGARDTMKEMRDTLAALGAGVAIAVVVSCGGSSKKATMAPMSASPDGGIPGMASDPKAQIEKLDADLTAEFVKLGAGQRPPAPSPAANLCPAPPCPQTESVGVKPGTDPTCLKGESQTCKDTCTIADSICDSAIKICKIAETMNNDAWANDKCSSGNASCETARGKCCGCL